MRTTKFVVKVNRGGTRVPQYVSFAHSVCSDFVTTSIFLLRTNNFELQSAALIPDTPCPFACPDSFVHSRYFCGWASLPSSERRSDSPVDEFCHFAGGRQDPIP